MKHVLSNENKVGNSHQTRCVNLRGQVIFFFLKFRVESYSTASKPWLYIASLPEYQPYRELYKVGILRLGS